MTMVVKINGVEETEVLNYITVWEMNEVGSCLIILDDTGGGSSAKYTPEAYAFEDIVIEYPSGTAIWKGRIRKIEYLDDMVVLHGEDWLGQYKDQVTSKDNIWDESGDIENVDYTNNWIQDTDKTWADDAFDGLQLLIKTTDASGARYNICYASEFEMTGMTYDGGDL